MGINKDLGLPFGDGMEKVAICFDVDGTLIENEKIYTPVVDMLNTFCTFKNVDVIVWSGGGKEYAETILRRIENNYFIAKPDKLRFYSKLQYKEVREKYKTIIAIDDIQDTRLGDVNLIVRNK